jgi:hypothetical protein
VIPYQRANRCFGPRSLLQQAYFLDLIYGGLLCGGCSRGHFLFLVVRFVYIAEPGPLPFLGSVH